eukprot:6175882-Pleurochrysis_carterae.AAC.1
MPAVDVLRTRMVLRVICKVDGGFVVQVQRCRLVGAFAELVEHMSNVRKYAASFAASDAAMISASQDDSATDGCFLLLQVMAARPYMNTCPDVE